MLGRSRRNQRAAIVNDDASRIDAHAAGSYRDAAGSPWLEGDAARSAAAFNLGNEAMRAEKFGEAARHYRRSLRFDPTRIDAKKNLEEAIRRSRSSRRPPQGGGGGNGPPSQGKENQGSEKGKGQQGAPSMEQPGGGPERPNQGRVPQLGNAIPDRSEAEHWLDALESERRAARQRDERGPEKVDGGRDW